MMIALFAPYLVDVFGMTTNIGCLFYAGVVASQCLVMERWGLNIAREEIATTYMRLAAVFAACAVIGVLPVVPGNEAFAESAKLIARFQTSVVIAAFIAFALSQLTLLLLYPKLRRVFGPTGALVLGMVACQAVDSPVFFTVAFPHDPDLIEFIIKGFLAKVLFGVALMPVVLWSVAHARQRGSAERLEVRIDEVALAIQLGAK